jgi:Domain of unknown function (DUF4349)
MRKVISIALFLAALSVLAGCKSGNEQGAGAVTSGGGGGESPQSLRSIDSQAGGSTKSLAASPQAARAAVPDVGPQVVQTATVRLAVGRGRFDEIVDEARSVAAGLGGFVVSSSASQGVGQRLVRGTLVLRIPARSYAEAMRSLAALGHVEARTENGQDVSQEFVDLRARVRQLQAVESQLLELLDRANSVGAALAVQEQLSQVQLELEQTRGRLQFLDDQVTFATISLGIHERFVPVAKGGGGRFGIVDAWSKAADGFLAVLGWTFVVLATAAPIVLILALAFLLGRAARRRSLPPLHRTSA